MSDQIDLQNTGSFTNIIPINSRSRIDDSPLFRPVQQIETPASDLLVAESRKLDKLSKYPCSFDYEVYRNLEKRYQAKPIRGGISMKTPIRLVNSHSTCQQCLYSFEVDTYGRGCIHECVYCYAKAELTVHGFWNNPIPVPVDLNEIRKAFYIAFETDKSNKWKDLLVRKIPVRIGSMSDSFMWMDQKYKITQELLKILKFYDYPYVIFTRSDLVATDEYMKLLDKNLASIQFSMSSTNDAMTKKIEPGAPSAKRRLKALEKLSTAGFWTTVRLNPFFPMHPDGYFTDPNFKKSPDVAKFDYSSFEMIDEIAAHKVPALLAGFVRLSSFAVNQIEKAAGFNLRDFYRKDLVNKSVRDFHYSDTEIRYYYEQIRDRAFKNNIEFTTCYIGNGEDHFWKDQDLWSNKADCCNIKGRVDAFKNDSREVPFDQRLKLTHNKKLTATSDRLHEALPQSPGDII
jgi:DNA repair photolyase